MNNYEIMYTSIKYLIYMIIINLHKEFLDYYVDPAERVSHP